MQKEKTFRIAALGCRTNQYEAQALRDQLLTAGWQEAGEGESADLCLINSCTVTEAADSATRRQIRQLQRQNPGTRLVVTGCSAESQREQILAIEGVSDVIANGEKERLLEQLFPEEAFPEFAINRFAGHTRAFVKVQDGCNSYCSYCIIPYVRGRSRSRTIHSVVREVERLVRNGYKEVVLTGINIGDFDGVGEGRLDALVRAVDQVEGLERLRLSSIDPDEVDEPLLEAIVEGRVTCQSLHMVLQAGSNVVLKRMNRKYTRQIFLETVDRLKAASPTFTFTTDVIIGFPGETEADFAETLAVIEEVQFAKVHFFPFSPRHRTRAAIMKNPVDATTMQKRKERLSKVAKRAVFSLREHYIGRRLTILTESKAGGHSDNFLWVDLTEPEVPANEMVEVEVVENSESGLVGQLVAKNVCCG